MLTESDIGLVYYSALTVSLIIGIAGTLSLKSAKAITRITGAGIFWNYSFKSTGIIAGMLGAMSVSYRGCDYPYSTSASFTLKLGSLQVSTACQTLAILLFAWLLIFLMLRLLIVWRRRVKAIHKVLGVGMVVASVWWFYSVIWHSTLFFLL